MLRATLMSLVLAAPLLAQGGPVALGDRIRVFAPQSGYDKLVGTVTATTPDVISMRVDGAVGEFAIRRAEIDLLQRSVARHRSTKRGFVGGILTGAALGMWFGPKGSDHRAYDASYTPPLVRNSLAGAAVGAVLGTGIGWLVRRDDWVLIRRDP